MLLALRYLLASCLHFAHFSFDFCLNSSIAFMVFCSYFLMSVTCAFACLVIDSLNSSSLDSLYTLAQILPRISLNFSLTSCLLLAQLFADFLLDSSFTSCSIIRLLLVQFFTRFCTCFLRAIWARCLLNAHSIFCSILHSLAWVFRCYEDLYKRICPSVRPSVRRSVRRSVTPSLWWRKKVFCSTLCRVSGLVIY